MQPCLYCGEQTSNPFGFCSDACFNEHEREIELFDADTVAGEDECQCDDEPYEMSDVEADADTLASAGYGTDEDYDCYSEPYDCDLWGEC